jgi:pyrimidine operon attenuation protein / uracil phosphoribosyltransferase
MNPESSLILDEPQIRQKIRRMAFEIYENNFDSKSLVIAGIDGHGYTLAKMLAAQLGQISPLVVKLVKVSIDKSAPQLSEISLDCDLKEIRKKCILLVDDVLNTGRTFAYSMKPFLSTEVKKIELAVLVNRSHTNFPVYPQYTGYQLATTLKDHVEVQLDGNETGVYLH